MYPKGLSSTSRPPVKESNGEYGCNIDYYAFTIEQEPLSSAPQRLIQIEERDKTDPTRKKLVAEGKLNEWETVMINGRKGLYQPGLLYWETDNSFIKIESFIPIFDHQK